MECEALHDVSFYCGAVGHCSKDCAIKKMHTEHSEPSRDSGENSQMETENKGTAKMATENIVSPTMPSKDRYRTLMLVNKRNKGHASNKKDKGRTINDRVGGHTNSFEILTQIIDDVRE